MNKKHFKLLSFLLLLAITFTSYNIVLANDINNDNLNSPVSTKSETPIVSKSTTTVQQMQNWAKSKKADQLFIDLASTFYNISTERGIDPALVYAQSALETGYMKFGGVIDASYYNPCGLKNSAGGGDFEGESHKRFNSWEEGISAQVDHLALYAGQNKYPKYNKELHDWYISKGMSSSYDATKWKKNGTTTDPRQYPYLSGTVKTVEGLTGTWASDKQYDVKLKNLMAEISNTTTDPDEGENGGSEKPSGSIVRYSGLNRYETSEVINKAASINSNIAVISSGESFPDMLVASTLAAQKNANLYMNKPNSVTSEINSAIDSGRINQVFLVGGNSITTSTRNKIKSKGIKIEEIFGKDRYETASKVANLLSNKSTVVLTNGIDFPDALSASPVTNKNGYPLLLTNGTSLTSSVNNLISKASNVIIIGGPGSVSTNIENKIKNAKIPVTRISGASRYDTSMAVANKYYPKVSSILTASGNNFADALSGTSLARKLSAPIILVPNDYLRASQVNYITSKKPSTIYLLGGYGSISKTIENNLAKYLK